MEEVEEPRLNDISFPIGAQKRFPIMNSKTGELIYLYFAVEGIDLIKSFINQGKHQTLRDVEIIDNLKEVVQKYFFKIFEKTPLEERISKSYENELRYRETYCSFILEIDDNFKRKPFLAKQMKNYRGIKANLMKNFSVEKKEKIFFNEISPKITSYQVLDKIGESLKDIKIQEESEDENEFLEQKEELENNIDYREILINIFANKINDFRSDIVKYCIEKDTSFHQESYEKFVCYIEFFTLLFTGIKVKYFVDELARLDMDFYSDEKNLMDIAELYHYQVQFRIMDIPIIDCLNGTFTDTQNKAVELEEFNSSKSKRIFKSNEVQFEDYKSDEVEFYPPYTNFIKTISDKVRRYDNNDNFHICTHCQNIQHYKSTYNLNCSSCFRYIDKTRLIYVMLSSICDVNMIEKEMNSKKNNMIKAVFHDIVMSHNQRVLQENLQVGPLIKTYIIPIDSVEGKRANKIFRNTFGEEVAFYYEWSTHYVKWLVFPAILGVIVYYINIIDSGFPLDALLGINIFFSAFIVVWGNFYVFSWHKKEEFIRHIWGMNSFKIEKNNNDIMKSLSRYSGTRIERFIGVKIPLYDSIDNLFKYIKTLTVFIVSLIVVIFVNLLILYIEQFKINEEERKAWYNKKLSTKTIGYSLYLIPVATFFVREYLSFLYRKVAKWVTDNENNLTKEEYKNSLLKKQLLFEFFNYYFNLYYIAFAKRYFELCIMDDCYLELGHQLSFIVISNIITTAFSIFYYGIYKRHKIKKFQDSLPQTYIETKNLSKKFKYYSRTEFDEEDINSLMLPIVMNFGYILQFGSASPAIFFFILCLVIFGRITNSISMAHLLYIRTLNESKGIEILNNVEGIFAIFGIFSNLCIIFYTNKKFIEMSSVKKLSLLVITENLIFFSVRLINFKAIPKWFDYRSTIEIKYLKKYGIKQKSIKKKGGKMCK